MSTLKYYLIFIVCFFMLTSNVQANNLTISNAQYNEISNEVSFNISWQNAWYANSGAGENWFDAAWIFIKYAPNGGASWEHVNLVATTVESGLFNFQSESNHGVMVYTTSACNNCNIVNNLVTIEIDPVMGTNPDFKIFAMEMVFIPEDPFYLGDAVSNLTYYEYPDTLSPYQVTSTAEITAGTNAGDINRKNSNFTTDIPENYPKGYRSFWAMKYKVTADQYVGFLNTLSRIQQDARTDADLSTSTISNVFVMTNSTAPADRNPIRCDGNPPSGPIEFYCDLNNNGIPNESDDGMNLILNYLSLQDMMAYLDWAGMRPMSKMEFEKMCRGPLYPIAGEYAWGTSGYVDAGNIVNSGMASETFDNIGTQPIWPDFYNNGFTGARAGFAATNSSGRVSSGATYYGVMDVHSSGNFYIGESFNNLTNFHYYNSQGDGQLAINGDANVPTWLNMQLNIVPSYIKNPISQGNLYSVAPESRISHTSFRGVIRLEQ